MANGKPGIVLGRAAAVLAWLGLGLCLLSAVPLVVQSNLVSYCQNPEWPEWSVCAPPLAAPEQVGELRGRIARNPGDAQAAVALAAWTAERGAVAPLNEKAVWDVTDRMARNDAVYLNLRATRAMADRDWAGAVPWLVRLVEVHRNPEAARTLVRLLGVDAARPAVVAAVNRDSLWVDPVLKLATRSRIPPGQLLALLLPALQAGVADPEDGLLVVRRIRETGQWGDAYALWLRLLARPVPQLFNGDFEQAFITGGFDWEIQNVANGRSGVVVQQQVIDGSDGRVLGLSFNGRPLMLPVIHQYTVLAPGRYLFSGRVITNNLRGGDGLAWSFVCLATGEELARTPAVLETRATWQELQAEVVVGQPCGAVDVQLVAQDPKSAQLGMRGDVAFDELRLSRVAARP